MALSFKNSKNSIEKLSTEHIDKSIMPTVLAEKGIDTLQEDFTRSDKYEWYNNYSDENFSIVDDNKNISVNEKQLNLTQEVNSQFIPFELSRYYDGIDLMEMSFRVHYVNAEGGEHYSTPINVTYSENKIRFGWLVDNYATAIEGDLTFEIVANGTNEKGQNYIWKTRPNGKVNILKSLSGNGVIKPDEDWYTQFVTLIDGKVNEARQAAKEAKTSADNAQSSANRAQGVVDGAKDEILQQVTGSLNEQLTTALLNYYTKQQVDNLIKNIDLTEALKEVNDKIDKIDGLAKFKVEYDDTTKTIKFYNGEALIKSITINTDPSTTWVSSYNKIVDEKVKTGTDAVKQELSAFKIKTEQDLAAIHSDVDGLPETLNTQYYKKPETDALLNKKASTESVDGIKNEVSVMKSSVQQMEGNVTALSGDVTRIEDIVNKINEKPSNTYEATYVDNVFSLLENGEVKNQFTIVGGGGSGADSTTITIERITPESLVVLLDAPTNIEFNFTSVDSAGDTTGNATATWKVGNTKVATSTVIQGKNSFDITPHLKIGANTIRMTVTDSFGTISAKTWTVTVVEFKIESNFDDTLFYSNEVIFRYTPYGNISKQIVFKLDGEQIATIGTSVTGRQMTQTIPKKPHGAHLLEVYMTADINQQSVKSNSIFKDIIWIEPENTTPIIGCSIKQFEVKQYNTYNIKYVIYDPEHNPSTITLHENEKLLSTLKVDRTGQTWSYKYLLPQEQKL